MDNSQLLFLFFLYFLSLFKPELSFYTYERTVHAYGYKISTQVTKMRSRSFPSLSTNPQSQSSEITTVRFLGVLQEIPCTHTHKMYLYVHTIYIDTYIHTHTHRYMTAIFTQTGIC